MSRKRLTDRKRILASDKKTASEPGEYRKFSGDIVFEDKINCSVNNGTFILYENNGGPQGVSMQLIRGDILPPQKTMTGEELFEKRRLLRKKKMKALKKMGLSEKETFLELKRGKFLIDGEKELFKNEYAGHDDESSGKELTISHVSNTLFKGTYKKPDSVKSGEADDSSSNTVVRCDTTGCIFNGVVISGKHQEAKIENCYLRGDFFKSKIKSSFVNRSDISDSIILSSFVIGTIRNSKMKGCNFLGGSSSGTSFDHGFWSDGTWESGSWDEQNYIFLFGEYRESFRPPSYVYKRLRVLF